jgi:transcriptional regulator with XRE-family HTH domain
LGNRKSRTADGIGGRLRAARERRQWSREELAASAGLSWSAIEQIESGRRGNPRRDTLMALAQALGVTIDYLAQGPVTPTAMLDHEALIYASEQELLGSALPFLERGIEASEAVLCVTTRTNIDVLRSNLGREANRAKFVESEAWLRTPVSALNAFRSFIEDGTSSGAPWVRILGEPIWAGRSDEDVRVWSQYESLLNLVFASLPVSVLCPYDGRAVDPQVANTARLTHPRVIAGDEALDNKSYQDPADFVLGRE